MVTTRPFARPAVPTVAVVLPPREGFGRGRSGAIGLLARRLTQTPGFRTVVFGGRQDGPVFPDIDFREVKPSAWTLGNTNIRYAVAVANILKALNPVLIEVHNRPEIALAIAQRLPTLPVSVILNNDPQEMRNAATPLERAEMLRRLALVLTSSAYLRNRVLDGVAAPARTLSCCRIASICANCRRGRAGTPDPVRRPGCADKGPDVFVSACAMALPQLPGWSAEIIGADRFSADSPDTGFVQMIRAAAEAANVRMLGYRDHPDVLAAMARAAIVVVPSRWAEPFGLVALEAMASGAALIASPRGGLPEVGGDAAVYADPDQPGAVANAIRALADDDEKRARSCRAGQQRARLFDAPAIAARLAALRRDILTGGG